jgi:predicted ABC-type ATPase
MDNSYRLEPSAHDAVYSDVIEPTYFERTSPNKKPAITIIAGQPGAGKSSVVGLSMKEFGKRNAVVVNTDDVRAFHPKFKEIVKLDDKRSAERTHEDASAWSQTLLERSLETKRHVVLEGVFKDAQKLLKIIEMAKQNGYEVTIRFIATHERYSLWGIHNRYEVEKVTRGHGRFVPLDYHDECYTKLLNTADKVEEQELADFVEVYNRDGKRVYENQLSKGKWKKNKAASVSIETERGRELTEFQKAEYVADWEVVIEHMQNRNAEATEIDGVKKVFEKLTEITELS